MTRFVRSRLVVILPAFLSLALIVVASCLPASVAPRLNIPFLDKLVHFSMFLLLGLTWTRALRGLSLLKKRYVVAIVIAFAALVGFFDELHQSYSPDRSAEVLDWIADVIGAVAGALLWGRILQQRSDG